MPLRLSRYLPIGVDKRIGGDLRETFSSDCSLNRVSVIILCGLERRDDGNLEISEIPKQWDIGPVPGGKLQEIRRTKFHFPSVSWGQRKEYFLAWRGSSSESHHPDPGAPVGGGKRHSQNTVSLGMLARTDESQGQNSHALTKDVGLDGTSGENVVICGKAMN